MAITPEEVRRIAALARLRLEDDEVPGIARDLSSILAHIDALAEVEADGPGDAPGPEGTRLRPDEADGHALDPPPSSFAPAFRDGLFLVPRLASHDPREERPADAEPDGDAEA